MENACFIQKYLYRISSWIELYSSVSAGFEHQFHNCHRFVFANDEHVYCQHSCLYPLALVLLKGVLCIDFTALCGAYHQDLICCNVVSVLN